MVAEVETLLISVIISDIDKLRVVLVQSGTCDWNSQCIITGTEMELKLLGESLGSAEFIVIILEMFSNWY